jgi:hypothetical protein
MRMFLSLFMALPLMLCAAQEPSKKVLVNNRVLAVVNGKVISVVDLMKKMDMMLYQYYPDYLEIPEARYQFYSSQWKELLSDVIDKELVIADAESKQFEISSGDVREELEEIFGPNVMINLDSAGLSMDEAWKLVKAEITIRRMMGYQVRQKILPQITPGVVKKAYQERVKALADQTEATWLSITIKCSNTAKAEKVAQAAYKLIVEEKIAHDKVEAVLVERSLFEEGVSLTVSQPFVQKSRELSPALQQLFASMEKGGYSKPQLQNSRSGQEPVVRIYHLQEMNQERPPSFQEVEPVLREEIAQELTEEGNRKYFSDLRQHFHVSKEQIEKDLPENFQPFELR